jgi:hypothetical protein
METRIKLSRHLDRELNPVATEYEVEVLTTQDCIRQLINYFFFRFFFVQSTGKVLTLLMASSC